MVVLPTSTLAERDFCPGGYYYSNGQGCYRSSWYWWGRWVLAGVVLLVFILLLLAFACISSRRRKSRGVRPIYGTGWMAPQNKLTPEQQQQWQQQQQGAYPQQGGYPQYPAPPAYGQPVQSQYTGTTFNPNDGYYGAQNEGIQLQQPQQAYQQPHAGVYSPPPGPPPGK